MVRVINCLNILLLSTCLDVGAGIALHELITSIEVRGSPEQGYFVPACIWSGWQAPLRSCLRVGAYVFRGSLLGPENLNGFAVLSARAGHGPGPGVSAMPNQDAWCLGIAEIRGAWASPRSMSRHAWRHRCNRGDVLSIMEVCIKLLGRMCNVHQMCRHGRNTQFVRILCGSIKLQVAVFTHIHIYIYIYFYLLS